MLTADGGSASVSRVRCVASARVPEDLSEVIRHLESCYPREGCGVLLRAGAEGPWRVRPLHNVQDALHASDPVHHPRTSRTAYSFEPREWLAVLTEADARGEHVACVFHSHVDTEATFSDEDRRQAAPQGQILIPGAAYLVMSVHSGCVSDVRIFWWDCGEFQERPVLPDSWKCQPTDFP
ncbi:M67 family metallopeptidase [Archangium sp.]|uniref:M67 family metallopeptidase n=1 Tax=Archangium sp. TaxID=1872627 RepID=UPI00286CF399|nr:M67 family metallopeptidase [Archangium sp.]